MERKLLSLIVALIVAFTFSSCDKEDENPVQSKTDLLTGSTWQLTGFTVNPPYNFNGTPISDLYAQFNCFSDNLIKFEKNGTMKQEAGTLKCFNGEPETIQGSWIFNTSETVITTTATGFDPSSYTVVELSGTTFKCSEQETEDGIVYTYTYVYSKK